ncbi:MAG: hypothetical protein IT428_31655 [Planctomycetaceae bacterium]|nr:hypothetical protein [Planctomycetaceae bacterium]
MSTRSCPRGDEKLNRRRAACFGLVVALITATDGHVTTSSAEPSASAKAAANASDRDEAQEGKAPADKGRGQIDADTGQKKAGTESLRRELLSGKVVLLQDALKRRGIRATAEMKDQAVLETDSGDLVPLVSDWRGRAFFQDKRLRDRRVDLVGMRRPGIPYFQVLMIFTFDEQGDRQYMDYWCDICSIPMYEIKPCDCCQADIRLRFQPRDLPEYIRKPNP